jgi:hypothetical protein
MTRRPIAAIVAVTSLLSCWRPESADAQTAPAPVPVTLTQARPIGSKWWIVGGGGFSMARAACASATCTRAGVFTNTKGLFFDIGGRVNPRVDAGVEVLFVTARLGQDVNSDPIRTTFIVGIAQFRPWVERGLYLRAGMGVGFAGNGIINPNGPKLKPPYTTSALGVTYGIGWIFRRERRWTVQANFSHHIAALGELTPESGDPIKNVVGNYWTSGAAIVFRPGASGVPAAIR